MIQNKYQDPKSEIHLELRHYRLHDFLEANPTCWFKSDEIQKELAAYYPDKKSTYRRLLVSDIQIINMSDVFHKKIISNRKGGYKIPTKEEYKYFSSNKWAEIREMIRRQRNNDLAYGMDGQALIQFEEVPYGAKTFEPFVRSNNL